MEEPDLLKRVPVTWSKRSNTLKKALKKKDTEPLGLAARCQKLARSD